MGLFAEFKMRMRTMGLQPDCDSRGWFKHRVGESVPSAAYLVSPLLLEEQGWKLERHRTNGLGETSLVYSAKRSPTINGVVQADFHEGRVFHTWTGQALCLRAVFGPTLGPSIATPDVTSWLERSTSFNLDSWKITARPFLYRGHPAYRGNIVAEDPRRIVITVASCTP